MHNERIYGTKLLLAKQRDHSLCLYSQGKIGDHSVFHKRLTGCIVRLYDLKLFIIGLLGNHKSVVIILNISRLYGNSTLNLFNIVHADISTVPDIVIYCL